MTPRRGYLLAAASLACTARHSPPPADTVFRGGAVYTVDSLHPTAQAVAVTSGRIAYVGDDSGVTPWIGPRTVVIDLAGKMLMPGFHDSHVHSIAGGLDLGDCLLSSLPNAAAVVDSISRCARASTSPWFRGSGWEDPTFPHANPRRELLDSLVPDRPAYIESADGHSAWVNSKALDAAGITTTTPDPPNGHIERDPRTRRPSGTLREAAMVLVAKRMPDRTPAEYAAALQRALALANQYGITSMFEANEDSAHLATYAAADAQGKLTAWIIASQYVDPTRGVEQIPRLIRLGHRFRRTHVRTDAIKIFADGVIESHTAALLEPYVGTNDRGPLNADPGHLDTLVAALEKARFQIHIHAIGDRAVRAALDAIAFARQQNGPRDTRPQIAHLEMVDTADVPRFRALGVFADFEPLWAFPDRYITEMTEPVLGPARSSRLYPMGEIERTGATLVGGSDWDVSSLNPLEAIQVAVTRRDPDGPPGPPWLPNEAISLPDILAAYTINGARLAFADSARGSITVGKWADLIVLDHNLLAVAPQDIHRTKVLLTLFQGHEVYRDPQWH
jgi:predicted amidohydrolase YtcJ